jgi:hypothetical protein
LKSLENKDIIILVSENQTMTFIPTQKIREQTGFLNAKDIKILCHKKHKKYH